MSKTTDVQNKSNNSNKNPFYSYIGANLGSELIDRKYGDVFYMKLYDSAAATAANYSTEWIAPRALELIQIDICYTVVSASGTLQLQRLQGSTAPDAGDDILITPVDLTLTANTVQSFIQTQMTSARVLYQGDRIGLVDGGNLSGLRNLIVSVYYKPSARGDYR